MLLICFYPKLKRWLVLFVSQRKYLFTINENFFSFVFGYTFLLIRAYFSEMKIGLIFSAFSLSTIDFYKYDIVLPVRRIFIICVNCIKSM